MKQAFFVDPAGLDRPAPSLSAVATDTLRAWQKAALSSVPDLQVEYASLRQLDGAPLSKALQSLPAEGALYLIASDALFRQELLMKLSLETSSLAAVVVDAPPQRMAMLKLGPPAARALHDLLSQGAAPAAGWTLEALFARLTQTGLAHAVLPGGKGCVLVQDRSALARFVFGTKAETLERLQPVLHRAVVPRLIQIKAHEWRTMPAHSLARVRGHFTSQLVVVRSSSHLEDGWDSSQAGAFDSVLSVNADSAPEVTAAVDRVLASYGEAGPQSQVLVQEMLVDVEMSGVLFTRTLNTGAPYYVINYDDRSGRTDSVTSGAGGELRTVLVHRSAGELSPALDGRLAPLLEAVREIERLLAFDALDIEFAISKGTRQVNILQVRPLVASRLDTAATDADIDRQLADAARRVNAYRECPPQLVGRRTLFGVMPDANPAELIGTKPKPLAFSLYRLLITEEIVARERADYGYIDIRPTPLMVNLVGHPYIDVRASFNSFTPAAIDPHLAEKLINFYVDKLQSDPSLHDKVEFEIVFTCWFADLADQLEKRMASAFSRQEREHIEKALANLTFNAIDRIDRDLAEVEQQKNYHARALDAPLSPLAKAVLLIEDSRRVGTGIFVRLARSGFVAITMLKSFVRCGYITQGEMDQLIGSLNSVTTQLEGLALAVKRGELPFEELVKLCGHLRPGTYDITSPAYFEDVESFIRPMVENAAPRHAQACEWREQSRTAIAAALKRAGIPISFEGFEAFCRKAIEGREYSKFVYTKSLSHGLRLLQAWGAEHGLTRDDLAFLEWSDFLSIHTGGTLSDRENLKAMVERSRALYAVRESLELPILFGDPQEIFSFEKAVLEPNYITQRKIVAEIVEVTGSAAPGSMDLAGKIVLIPRADPGFDWLFSQQIGGLITMYGGANSHMAIRSAEQRVPAAIGVGEKIYTRLSNAKTVSLNCESRSINVIN